IKFKMMDDINDVLVNHKKYCSMVREELAIDSLGDIYPCQFFVALPYKLRTKYILGNINKEEINTELVNEFKHLKICKKNIIGINFNRCKTCKIDRFCQKVCYGFNINEQKFDSKLIKNAIYFEKLLFKLIQENM
ncbi:MAG: SPASM domain-containing protein, partial [Candidatus Parcubacteria bacterium]|nr:SPASM domain-containing protein [Candidatus Parcubacteria bacterium]